MNEEDLRGDLNHDYSPLPTLKGGEDLYTPREDKSRPTFIIFILLFIVAIVTFLGYLVINGYFKSEINQSISVSPEFNASINVTSNTYPTFNPTINVYLNQTVIIQKLYLNSTQ